MPDPAPLPKPRRRLWRWLKRMTLLGGIALGLLVLFHRWLILSVLQWAGPQGAATQGLPLTWQVAGSLWNDLEINALSTGGGEAHWLPRATLGRLSLTYDLRSKLEHLLRGVTLHDLEAEVDLRHLPTSDQTTITVTEKASGKAPPLVWPEFFDLKNLNAKVTLADGRQILVKGLTLQAGKGMPGLFTCQELSVLPSGPKLTSLHAAMDWQPRLLVIRDFALPENVVLDELRVDLKDYESGHLLTKILAHFGAAKLQMETEVKDVFGSQLRVATKIHVADLRSQELHSLGLPKDVNFDGGQLNLHVEGDPLQPSQLKAETQFKVANLRAGGALMDHIELALDVRDAQASLTTLRILRGTNRIEATAHARLPAQLDEWPKTAWTAELNATLADVPKLLEKPPPAGGTITLKAHAEGRGATATQVTGDLRGESLAFESYRLPRFQSQLSLNGQEARWEIPPLALGQGNEIALKASMQMEPTMPVKAEWRLQVTNPAQLISALGLPAPEKPAAGQLLLTGQSAFIVQKLTAGHYDGVTADVALTLQKAKLGDAPLPEIALEMKAQEGQAKLTPCTIRVDANNDLQWSAEVALKPPFAFTTEGAISMPALTSLNTLLKSFGAPEIRQGAVVSQVNARGQLQPWQCEGKATLSATQVQTATLPEPADLNLAAEFIGTRADLKSLEAKLGLWKLALTGVIDDQSATLSQLRLWQHDTLLMEGHASAPFDIMQASKPTSDAVDVVLKAKDLRVHEVLAAAGLKDMPAATLTADIALQGRLETLQGHVALKVRDVKVPNAPKSFGPGTVDLETKLQSDQMTTQVRVLQPPLQPLTVEASMPLDVDALAAKPALFQDTPLKVAVRMARSDLDFLREQAPDLLKNLPAKLKLDADVSGTVAKPAITAAVDLDVSEVTWTKADMPSMRDVKARIRLKDQRLTVEEVSLMMAGGRVKLLGSVDAKDLKNPALDLRVEAREALVFRDPTTSLRTNADVTCLGTLQKARVAGLIEAVRGRVFKEIDLLPVLKLPADVPPVPENTQRSSAQIELPPLLKDWTFDLRVKTRDPLLISGNLANGAISADVLLGGTGAAPTLTGGANIDRLLLKLPFSLVKITQGVVTMNPLKPFDPKLDIRGESRVGSHDITLYIYGDSTNPKTRFVSSPPMSEPDIVTLLATGTTLNGSASDLASEAASRAALLFVSELYRKTFNKKKVVREEPPRLHMSVNPSGADRSNDSVQAMYDLTDNWRITGRFTQTGRMKALLGYILRFGEAARAVDEPR